MQFITTSDLAKLLSVHENTVRRWTRDGRIPHIKISETDFRYEVEKVIAALEKQAK